MGAVYVNLENMTIVLHRPRFPENIGAAARAACNMGIRRMIVVSPEDFDLAKISKMATHVASDIVEKMGKFENLALALAPFQYVVGTTARIGGNRPAIASPKKLAETLVPISQNNRVALLFGPEDRGLTNEDLAMCHAVVTIPTADFSSLNLAQAVMVLCYEIFQASYDLTPGFAPRLATRRELEEMYQHLKETFVAIHFINPENPDYWMRHVRRFFSRIALRGRDVKMIRGVCRQIKWYGTRKDENV